MHSEPSLQFESGDHALGSSVLIIAGEQSLGPFFASFVDRLGFRSHVVEIYGNSGEVLNALSHEQYDLLLVTNNTLRPDQIPELVSRARSAYPELAIVVVSGYTAPEFISEVTKRGANDFIPIPFEADQLIASVKRHCQTE